VVVNIKKAAREMGIGRTTLKRRIKSWEIAWAEDEQSPPDDEET